MRKEEELMLKSFIKTCLNSELIEPAEFTDGIIVNTNELVDAIWIEFLENPRTFTLDVMRALKDCTNTRSCLTVAFMCQTLCRYYENFIYRDDNEVQD